MVNMMQTHWARGEQCCRQGGSWPGVPGAAQLPWQAPRHFQHPVQQRHRGISAGLEVCSIRCSQKMEQHRKSSNAKSLAYLRAL